jgi:hypothetical protein
MVLTCEILRFAQYDGVWLVVDPDRRAMAFTSEILRFAQDDIVVEIR